MSDWWNVFESGDFDRRRDMSIFYEPALRYTASRWWTYDEDLRNDYASLAGEVLVLAAIAPGLTFEPTSKQFWSLVKTNIDWAIGRYAKGWKLDHAAQLSYDALEDDETRDAVTALRVPRSDTLLINTIADHYSALPTALKAVIGLHFFEELTYDQVGKITMSASRARRWITGTTKHLAGEGRAQVATKMQEVPDLPNVDAAESAETLVNVAVWVRRSHGVDLAEWLGWLDLAYRVDVSYLAQIIGHGNGNMVHFGKPAVVDYAADVEHLEQMDPPPASRSDLRARTGWSHPRVAAALQEWRRKHGLETPKNGGQAARLRVA